MQRNTLTAKNEGWFGNNTISKEASVVPVVCLTKSPLKMLGNSTWNWSKSFYGEKVGVQRRKFHQTVIADEISYKSPTKDMHKTDWWFSKRAM